MNDFVEKHDVSSTKEESVSKSNKEDSKLSVSKSNKEDSKLSVEEIVYHGSLSTREMKHKILTEPSKMDTRPHMRNNIRNYLEMVRENNDFKNKPAWDSYQESIYMDMIKTNKNYKLVSELLEAKRLMRIKIRDRRDMEINDLMNKEKYFGHLFQVYDKFLKENFEKRERAIDKIQSERALRSDLDKEIIKVYKEAQKLAKLRLDVKKAISERQIFVDFLESVRVIAPNQFRNGVSDVIDRYQVLLWTRAQLAQEQQEALNKIQSLSDEMFKISDEHSKQLVHLRNKYTEMTCRYDIVKHEAIKWESLVNKIESLTANKMTQLFELKSACYILYLQISRYLNKPPKIAKSDVRRQLMFIEKNIALLKDAWNVYRKHPERMKKGSHTNSQISLYKF